jgi:ParB family chromosome partitioning protein
MTTDTEQPYNEMTDEDEHFEWVPVADLHDDPENLRDTYDGIEDLAASIKAHGLKQPIVCHRDAEGQYWIEAGHRRKRALVLAGHSRARVIVRHKQPLPEERIATMLIENGHRKDLNPMEQAFGLERIRKDLASKRGDDTRVSDADLGKYIGRSQVWVTDRVKLLALEPKQQQMVREGRMTLGEGKRVGRLNSGTTRPGAQGKQGGGFFTSHHPQGSNAANRCKSLGHKSGGPNWIAIACGKCWEHVLRTDERTRLQKVANEDGHCPSCNQPVDTISPKVDTPGKVE